MADRVVTSLINKFIDFIGNWQICLSVSISMFCLLICKRIDIIYLPYDWTIYVFMIFLLTIFFCIIKFIMYKKKLAEMREYNHNIRIKRLNKIFVAINDLRSDYVHLVKRDIITYLYKNNLKSFIIEDVYLNYQMYSKTKLQDEINELVFNDYRCVQEPLMYMKNGKYTFYNDVWDELKLYNKNGLIGEKV